MTLHPQARQAATAVELAFVVVLALRPSEADALGRLYAAKPGEPIQLLRVHACAIRKALEPEALDTALGGYLLTDQGRAECAQAVGELRKFVEVAA